MDQSNRKIDPVQSDHDSKQDEVDYELDYDLSFAYNLRWDSPDQQLKEAFRVLLGTRHLDEVSQDKDFDPMSASKIMGAEETFLVRWRIAVNPKSPPPVLDGLAWQDCPKLLERIAENPQTSKATLSRLARSRYPEVRAAVTENSTTSSEDIWLLAGDESPDVRFRLAENHNISIDVLESLIEDDNPYVSDRAYRTVCRLRPGTPVYGKFAGNKGERHDCRISIV